MSKFSPWSNASAACRLDLQASRLFVAFLFVLGLLAGTAAVASELPWSVSYPLAAAAVLQGALLAGRELRRPPVELVMPFDGRDALIDGESVRELELQWRGPLAFLRWRTPRGDRRHLQGWPDNLDPTARRELRLATGARPPARSARSMAP